MFFFGFLVAPIIFRVKILAGSGNGFMTKIIPNVAKIHVTAGHI